VISSELNLHFRGPSKDVIKEYRGKVGFLQKVVDDAVMDNAPKQLPQDLPDGLMGSLGLRKNSSASHVSAPSPPSSSHHRRSQHLGLAPPPARGSNGGDPLATEIHQRIRERRNVAEREMLFGANDNGIFAITFIKSVAGFFLNKSVQILLGLGVQKNHSSHIKEEGWDIL
jgi:hypothetical protein